MLCLVQMICLDWFNGKQSRKFLTEIFDMRKIWKKGLSQLLLHNKLLINLKSKKKNFKVFSLLYLAGRSNGNQLIHLPIITDETKRMFYYFKHFNILKQELC